MNRCSIISKFLLSLWNCALGKFVRARRRYATFDEIYSKQKKLVPSDKNLDGRQKYIGMGKSRLVKCLSGTVAEDIGTELIFIHRKWERNINTRVREELLACIPSFSRSLRDSVLSFSSFRLGNRSRCDLSRDWNEKAIPSRYIQRHGKYKYMKIVTLPLHFENSNLTLLCFLVNFLFNRALVVRENINRGVRYWKLNDERLLGDRVHDGRINASLITRNW